jgi:ABC-type lipoprotein release transport system permease subunit
MVCTVPGSKAETSPRDGTVFAGVTGLLALAAFLATLIPTHRSTQVDSATALRAE